MSIRTQKDPMASPTRHCFRQFHNHPHDPTVMWRRRNVQCKAPLRPPTSPRASASIDTSQRRDPAIRARTKTPSQPEIVTRKTTTNPRSGYRTILKQPSRRPQGRAEAAISAKGRHVLCCKRPRRTCPLPSRLSRLLLQQRLVAAVLTMEPGLGRSSRRGLRDSNPCSVGVQSVRVRVSSVRARWWSTYHRAQTLKLRGSSETQGGAQASQQ